MKKVRLLMVIAVAGLLIGFMGIGQTVAGDGQKAYRGDGGLLLRRPVSAQPAQFHPDPGRAARGFGLSRRHRQDR